MLLLVFSGSMSQVIEAPDPEAIKANNNREEAAFWTVVAFFSFNPLPANYREYSTPDQDKIIRGWLQVL
jgi:abortive infection bacteriophage resistance protein